ncbi:MAG TPA: hypothetical protein VLU96_00375 [Gaiellaceae bacterium]|nr:hypothetical protein [Gaiellaceae bacterium]
MRLAVTVRFPDASEATRQRVLRAGPLDAFCGWPEGTTGSGLAKTSVELGSRRRAVRVSLGTSEPDPMRFTCGLHAHTDSPGDNAAYERSAVVAAHLTPAQ